MKDDEINEKLTNLRDTAVNDLVDLFWKDIPDKILNKYIQEEKAAKTGTDLQNLLDELIAKIYITLIKANEEIEEEPTNTD
jgi:hypothetical protein